MTGAGRAETSTAGARLRRIAAEAIVLTESRDRSNSWTWITVPRIRQLLERSIDLLATAAHEATSPDLDLDLADETLARRLTDARNEIASHLRAAEHVEAAKPQQAAHVDLLLRAVDVLTEALAA